MRKRIPAVFLSLALAGCASSGARLIDSYRAPGTVSLVFERVAVLVLNGGPDLRSRLEGQIVGSARQPRLVAAHAVLAAADMSTVERIRQKLLEANCDGAVTLRLLRATEVNPAASERGVSFTSYAGSVAPDEPVFGEGRLLVEASFYRLSDEALIWRGIVEGDATKDPNAIVQDATDVIRRHLRGTGLVHDS